MTIGLSTLEVFPSTKTKTLNKLITENSLTRLINKLIDVDGYIISTSFPSTTLSEPYDYIEINNDNTGMLDAELELSLHGYYFDLGTYAKVLGEIRDKKPDLQEGNIINAVIYIDDTSNPEYPELDGYDYETIIVNNINGEFDFKYPTYTPDNTYNFKYYDKNNNRITSIEIGEGATAITVSTDDLTYAVVDGKGVIKYADDIIDLNAKNIAKVTFIYESTKDCISFYLDGEQIEKEGFTAYTLTLFELKMVSGELVFRIPLSSLHKFDTISLFDVDGGHIQDLNSET